MLHENLLILLGLLLAVSLLVVLGQRLGIAYPILLVIGGLVISIIPGMPIVSLQPELVFLVFLPPLLYEAAWFTSWKQFIHSWRPISMLAFGLVFITSLVVALFTHWLIPGFTLAMGFLLGGIISPPDAVAATSVLKFVKVPKRIVTVLEGESLINDASSLIVFRFALAAILTGQFSMEEASIQFLKVTVVGIIIGLAIAQLMYWIHRHLPTTANVDVALTLMTPYILYMGAEHFECSGVMAVVTGGLFLSNRSHLFLNKGNTRIQANSVWSTFIFILNGLVFILIGLELPVIVAGLGNYSLITAIRYGLAVSLVAIVVRLVWVLLIAYIPNWMGRPAQATNVNPAWKAPLIVGWAGMRGVVSLAAALSVPLLLPGGQAFPDRNLILFITFIVILVTLVLQGLSLPWVIRQVNIKETDELTPEEEQIDSIRLRLREVAINDIEQRFKMQLDANELLQFHHRELTEDAELLRERLNSIDCDENDIKAREEFRRIRIALIDNQRKTLAAMRRQREFDDEIIRHEEVQLDLEQAKLLAS